ncbi:hypothetical protein AaE_000728 [Aphanomyces astaci]|uniref:Fibronectin type-III domain-containing protein n=1 Tax=Aphanomyces astaci TaxID=112090 RepID=A0A6A5AYG1_APHAT|nr:hypothetical protein AaE_000728 [Aphanomyces astaci]
MLAPTPHQRHHDKVEKRLLEKFRVSNVLLDSDEHAKINEMVARVAKLAAEDNLREDGTYLRYVVESIVRNNMCRVLLCRRSVHCIENVQGDTRMFVWAMDQADPVASVGRSAVTANQCLTRGAVTGSRVAICAGSEPSTCRWNDQAQTLTVQHRGTRFGHDDVITCSCFTPDGSILVTASMDTTCIFWQADTMALLGVLHAHHGGVSWCGFSPDGQFLFTCGALDYLTKRWAISAWLAAHAAGGTNSTTTPPVLSEQPVHQQRPPSASAGEVIGSALTTPTNPTSLDEPAATLHDQSYHHVTPPLQPSRLLDWSARQKYNRALDSLFSPDITLQTLTGEHHLPQFCMNDDWSHNRHTQNQPDLLLPPLYEFTSSDDGTVGLREAADDPAALTQLESIDILSLLDPTSSTKHPLCHDRVSFEANDIPLDAMPVVVFECRTTHGVYGFYIFVQHTHTINWCTMGTPVVSPPPQPPPPQSSAHGEVASTGTNDIVVTVASDKCIKFWHAEDGRHIHTIRHAHDRDILTCAMSSAPSTYLATGSSDSFVKIWNPSTFECVYTLRGHFDSVLSVAFTPSGTCVYSAGHDAQVIKWQVIPTEPGIPKQPVVTNVDCHAIDIAWLEPLGNGARIEKYQIKVAKANGPFGMAMDVSADDLLYCIDRLDPGCVYSFCVAAVNRVRSSICLLLVYTCHGVATWDYYRLGPARLASPRPPLKPWLIVCPRCISATASLVVFIGATVVGPSKVKKPCTLSDVDTRSVMLEWLVPTANGAAISHYHIRCIPEDPLDMEPTVDIRVSVDEIQADTRAAHDAIQAEIDRKAKIREDRRIAANAKRPKRTEKSVERSEKLRKQSDQRKQRLATHSSLSTTLLSSAAADIPVRPVVPVTLKFKVSCVHPGTIYQFEIAAENRCGIRCGIGDYNVPSSYIKTTSCAPDAPAAPTISNITSHTVDMTWEKPRHNGSDIVHYTLEWAQDGRDVESVVVLTRSLPTTVHTVTQLAAGTWIQVRVQASNVIDKVVFESPFSPWSGRVKTLPSVPAAPAKPVLASATSHTLTVNFVAPCDNGKPIQRYHVMLFIEDDSYGVVSQRFCQQLVWSLDELTTVENDGFKAELVGLKASKRYVVAMAAENELGKGDFSPVSQGVPTKPATVPNMLPMAPMVSNVHPTKVDLAWTVPSHDGGSAVTAYAIEYSLNDGPFENELKIQRLDTTLTLDFLKPKATYSFRVAGVNAAGTATYSLPTDPITTPSLVEHTLRHYFLHRPPQEHIAATSIQIKCSKTYMTLHMM